MGTDMNLKGIIPPVFAFPMIIACDLATTMDVYVVNNSNYDLEARYEVEPYDQQRSVSISSGQEYLIITYSAPGPHASIEEAMNYVKLYYQDSLVYEQNPIDYHLWEYKDSKHYLTITDDDLDIGD